MSSRHHKKFQKSVQDPTPRYQHRSITVHLTPVVNHITNRKRQPRFNYQRAKWENFTSDLEEGAEDPLAILVGITVSTVGTVAVEVSYDQVHSVVGLKVLGPLEDPTPEGYESFQRLVWDIANKNIPRGCRKQYNPGLTDTSKEIYDRYIEACDTDPFA